jgi:dTDP-4-dehydrorhamnose reductase
VRIVVTGREGQVARSLVQLASGSGVDIIPVGRPQLDLCADPAVISRAIEAVSPDAIISAAAYTAVDRAESEADTAFTVNARGAEAVAAAAARLRVPLVHLSTDYVFDGTKSTPYVESDPSNPSSVYGASKLAGEEAVLAANGNTAVLRTAWVYSPFGANFVRTMLRLTGEREEVAVVADQVGNPTSALDIADAALRVAANLVSSASADLRGVFHMTASGEATWAQFAEAIFRISRAAGGPAVRVRHITSAEYPTPARRPANSRLDSSKLERIHGVRLPDWQTSLPPVVERLLNEANQTEVSR